MKLNLLLQDLLRLAENSGSTRNIGESKEIADKLADTINLEIIEPLSRVNRAYRFTKTTPQCERYVLCLVNRGNRNEGESIPGLKKLLSQMSSLLAGWFLSSETGTSYWTLYTDIVGEMDCQSLYSDKCNDFHVEEMRVTTEYVHNEL
ncbi:hypothetical protein JTB14_007143 [Gonioctena quinquepunctata]|nr:hypothetical protein JTB14_007143 [Gonioctena quinquepunctata]